jgi:hypothetical protein
MAKDARNPEHAQAQKLPPEGKEPNVEAPEPQGPDHKIQGEGDYEAARRYRADVEDFVKQAGEFGVRNKAIDAERAIDGAEGEDLRRAEAKGQAPARR